MKVLALFLSLLISLSSIQWELNYHYCKGKFASLQLFSADHEGCGMEQDDCHKPKTKQKSCCTEEPAPKEEEPCCDDQTIDVSIEQPFILSKSQIPNAKVFIAEELVFQRLQLSAKNSYTKAPVREPPPAFKPPLYLTCCSFRFYG